jgi:hypothetical protein
MGFENNSIKRRTKISSDKKMKDISQKYFEEDEMYYIKK